MVEIVDPLRWRREVCRIRCVVEYVDLASGDQGVDVRKEGNASDEGLGDQKAGSRVGGALGVHEMNENVFQPRICADVSSGDDESSEFIQREDSVPGH